MKVCAWQNYFGVKDSQHDLQQFFGSFVWPTESNDHSINEVSALAQHIEKELAPSNSSN
jgi:hypothetical protein